MMLKLPSNCSTKFLKETSFATLSSSASRRQETTAGYCNKIARIIRAINSEASDDLKLGLHAAAIKSALSRDVSVATSLICLYLRENDLNSAWSLFHLMPMKDSILWTAMVSGLCKIGQFMEAIDTFRKLQFCFLDSNVVTYLSVLPACANMGSLQHGKQIHASVIRRGLHLEVRIQNSLIGMYVKCSNLYSATSVFDAMMKKDSISWTNMILGFIRSGKKKEAIDYFTRMRASQVEPGENTVRNLISICLQPEDVMLGEELHCYLIKSGQLSSASTGTAVLKMYGDLMEVGMAQLLFRELQNKDYITWSAMISVYSHARLPILAIDLFRKMVERRIHLNEITFVSVLQACSLSVATELGRSTHAHLIRLGFSSNEFLISSLIDFYSKLGNLRKAEILFSKLGKRDLVSWSSMINGYGVNGQGEKAIKAFSAMIDHGLMPNGIAFVCLFSACSHCGLVDEGLNWFSSMEQKYGVSPSLGHYASMVDLLSRHGRVERALALIETMPWEPDASIWVSLLSHCGFSDGDLKVAALAAERLVRMNPNDSSCYVTVFNSYSKLGQWVDARRIRGLLEDKSLKKAAGFSMI
ncbi:Putative pentatricopeptide repeat-containing protein [Apostasia shenzhenica]|uniref:Pentatricopeptide repeat-containing protein n=1 Tax=Apostasia shenzhenica TaxID=1088818 RepID=A0A2I0B8G9_9ASPA|nr:Putative pentatricopeptide repeat-containing protein [Apostasia shenzhenica]